MDAKSFKHKVMPHYDLMYRYAYFILYDKDDALDAVQSAIATLWEKRDTLASVDNLAAFCVTSAKHQAIDILRRRPRSVVTLDEITEHEDTAPTVTDTLEHVENLDRVKSILSTFTPVQQEIMRLRAQAECTVEEIAYITSMSEENVRQVLSRTRRKLKELYNKTK